jgi:adenosylcobinamide kinase/adenosylcobinamide-phosphate guanylyltransferase
MNKQLILVLGGARSGKSAYAQNLIEQQALPALFIATATAGDDEMQARIAAHQASRLPLWITLEAPTQVGRAYGSAPQTEWALLDCMTLLVSNLLLSQPEPVDESAFQKTVDAEIDDLLAAYHQRQASLMIVSNEVGLGLVPPYVLGRYYRDALGRANQRLAQAADQVVFMVAGLPLKVKG